MADLLFDWFGFDQTIKTVVRSNKHPNKINRRPVLVFSYQSTPIRWGPVLNWFGRRLKVFEFKVYAYRLYDRKFPR